MKKHNTVYQITNLLNGKIYIGVHQTDDLNDGYMGSGKAIKNSIKKYGIENFKKEILFNFCNKEEMYNTESKLVNEEFIERKDTYNLHIGGNGGWEHVNNSLDKNKIIQTIAKNNKNKVTIKDKYGNKFKVDKNDPKYLSGELLSVGKGLVMVKNKNGEIFNTDINDPRYLSGELVFMWKGCKHSEETKQKIGIANSKHQRGKGNSQYGTCWIVKEKHPPKKVSKENLQEWLDMGWIRGRKIKNKLKKDLTL